MGNAYDFKCPFCHFEASCSKKIDSGFRIQVEPMYCSKCKVLKNIHIGNFPKDEFGKTQLELLDRICEKCNTGEHLTSWNGMDCPICGHFRMKQSKFEICWD